MNSKRLATLGVLGAIALPLGMAIASTCISLTFSPEDPARFLAVLRRLFPWRPFTYLGDPANIRQLLGGIATACPFLWMAAIVTALLFKPLRGLLRRILEDVSELPAFLRQDLSRAWFLLAADKLTSATLALTVVAGSALRMKYVATDMNCDELMKFFDSSFYGPISTASVFGQEPWHTFSNHLMYLGWQIFGLNHWGIRAHSVLTGCLLIVLTFVVASYWFNRYVGLIAAATVSGSAVMVAYSVYARNYIHIPFLGMATLLLVHRGLWDGRTGYLYLAALATILGLYGLPTMSVFFALALLMLADHLIRSTRSGSRPPWRAYAAYPIATVLLTALLFVPFVIVSGYADFMGTLTEQQNPTPRTLVTLLAASGRMLVLYRQLLPEWLPPWLWPGLIVAGAAVSMVRPWRGRAMLMGVLSMTLLAAWAGMGFGKIRLYSYLIPFFGMAAAIIAIEAWSALWRARGLVPRGVAGYAAVVSVLVLLGGLSYSAQPENVFGTKSEERVFGRRQDSLIVPNAQGVEEMVDYLHKNGLLRDGVLVDTQDFTFHFPIRFALLERGYPDSAHFSMWRNFPNPRVIYEVYSNSRQAPEYRQYQDVRLRRGRVLMSFERSTLVEFVRDSPQPTAGASHTSR